MARSVSIGTPVADLRSSRLNQNSRIYDCACRLVPLLVNAVETKEQIVSRRATAGKRLVFSGLEVGFAGVRNEHYLQLWRPAA